MDLHTGSPYWFLINGLRTVVPPITVDTSCDVVVIGAGITGALVTKSLIEADQQVVVLDERDLGLGSTVASTALLQYDLDVPLYELIVRKGREPAGRAFRAGVEAICRLQAIGAHIGSPVERVPSLYLLLDPSREHELRAEYEARSRAGLDVSWAEGDRLRSDWGIDARAAIISSHAAQMDPYDFTHRLWSHNMHQGARVFDRTRVTDVNPGNRDSLCVHTDRGPAVTYRHVVYAIGYAAARYLPEDAVKLVSTYAIASEPTRRTAKPFTLWEFNDPYLYARWANGAGGDRLIVGGGDVRFVDADKRDALIGAKSEYLLRRAKSILPKIPLETAFAWSGTFATTDDGLGFIGALPGRPREMIALGFGGNGITMSQAASEIIRDEILGTTHPLADLYRPERVMDGRVAPALA